MGKHELFFMSTCFYTYFPLFTRVSLNTRVYVCLPLFTLASLHKFTRVYRLPMFTLIYLCLHLYYRVHLLSRVTYVFQYLLVHVYLC